jgi:hypothetical protein
MAIRLPDLYSERQSLCHQLSRDLYTEIEPKLESLVSQLNNQMEIRYFLSCLDDKLIISMLTKLALKEFRKKQEELEKLGTGSE